ncbi:MAG TPA: gamma-glutamyltransferase [Gammaproteobacteria bacterium]|nr:gamma-glutamyltransferase [Gammaproteobacteria bacterium]
MSHTQLRHLLAVILFFYATLVNAQPTPVAKQGMVVSEQVIASQIGVDIMRAGGNAIDAAVAVGYALAVIDPCCGNIGGGGFMLIHLADGKNVFINFREKAPLHANAHLFDHATIPALPPPDDTSARGYITVAVPGTVLGLDTALQTYGTMTRQQVMAPAIQLAKQGVIITAYEAERYKRYTDTFRQQPNVAAIFMKNGKPLAIGDRLIQTDLAQTLTLIANKGSSAFYQNSVAKAIVAASEAHGGVLSLKDFTDYTVETLTPIICDYHGYTIITSPPPGSGIVLCEMLNILENFQLSPHSYYSTEDIRVLTETMRYGFIDRNNKLGDPDFMRNPTTELLSKDYAASLSKKIKTQHIAPAPAVFPYEENVNTTHYSVMDKQGNAVSVTYTLNGFFGARVIAGSTGFFLNDEIDDFATQPNQISRAGILNYDLNAIQPGRRPLSSMTPTIVMKNSEPVFVLGSPGGPRIITTLFLALVNLIDYKMDLQQAIDAPRFHFQYTSNTLSLEPYALPTRTMKQLQQIGYVTNTETFLWGAVAAIQIEDDGTLIGAMDKRRPDGGAVGY